MRLIDADVLKEKSWDVKFNGVYVQVVDVGDIDEMPTVKEPSAQQWIVDALKEHLGEAFEPITENEKEFKDWLERMRWHVYECDKLVRELEQAKKSAQQFIPCTERLPKAEKKSYWVCTDTGYQCECRWTNVNPFWTNLTADWNWNIFDIPQYTKVAAWRELPEPWKGEEK